MYNGVQPHESTCIPSMHASQIQFYPLNKTSLCLKTLEHVSILKRFMKFRYVLAQERALMPLVVYLTSKTINFEQYSKKYELHKSK